MTINANLQGGLPNSSMRFQTVLDSSEVISFFPFMILFSKAGRMITNMERIKSPMARWEAYR